MVVLDMLPRFFEWSRYPWLCGYLIAAPVGYWFASNQRSCSSWAEPLILLNDDQQHHHAGALILAIGWYFHFFRRAFEVVFVNRYHGKSIPGERDSIVEFFYYLFWGYINGLTGCCIQTNADEIDSMMNLGGTVSKTGLALYVIGETGNYLCHAHLRALRPDPNDTQWKIPTTWPFSILVAPHYSFELLGWLGYAMLAGFAPPTISILIMSFVILNDLATSRKKKYIKLTKDMGTIDVKTVEDRYLLIPYIY